MLTLKTQERDIAINATKYRKEGLLPSVYYGPKMKPVSINVSKVDFMKVWKEAGESTVVALETKDGLVEVLIHEVSYDAVKSEAIHVDFFVLEVGKIVEVSVPLEFVGVSKAVKDMAGTLVKVLHEIEVEALPKDFPHSLKVDISLLSDLDAQILASDIVLPAGVTLLTDADEVVAAVSVADEEEVAAPSLATIEVAKKGKKEVDGAVPVAKPAGKK